MCTDIQTLISLNKDLHNIVDVFLDKDQHAHPKTETETFVLLAFAKAYKTHNAILILCEQGYGEDAITLSRTLLELSLHTLLIEQDKSGFYAKRYIEFDYVLQNEYYKQIIKQGQEDDLKKRIDLFGDIEGSIESINQKAKEVLSSYKKEERGRNGKGVPHWSGMGLKKVAKKVGRSDLYEKVYTLQCSVAHSDVKSANNYIAVEDDRLVINVSPSENWVLASLVATMDCFGIIVNTWDRTFDHGLEEDLKKPADDCNQLLAEINKRKL